MACEAERQAVDNAMLALSTSVQAATQALAVVQANIQALQAAQQALAICEFNHTNPPGP